MSIEQLKEKGAVKANMINESSNMGEDRDWEYNSSDTVTLEVRSKDDECIVTHTYTVREGEPEDMSFGRNLEDTYSIQQMVKLAYNLGQMDIKINEVIRQPED